MLTTESLAQIGKAAELRQQAIRNLAKDMDTVADALGFPGKRELFDALLTVHGAKGRRRVPPDVRQKIVERLEKGATAPQLAREYDVSENTIGNIKKEAGLVKRKRGKANGKSAVANSSATS